MHRNLPLLPGNSPEIIKSNYLDVRPLQFKKERFSKNEFFANSKQRRSKPFLSFKLPLPYFSQIHINRQKDKTIYEKESEQMHKTFKSQITNLPDFETEYSTSENIAKSIQVPSSRNSSNLCQPLERYNI